MFGIGMPEMLLILAIALIVIGPKKLPDLAKSLGRAMREFKKATNEFKETMHIDSELAGVKNAFNDISDDVKEAVDLEIEPEKKIDDPPRTDPADDEKSDAKNETSESDDIDNLKNLKHAFDNLDPNSKSSANDETTPDDKSPAEQDPKDKPKGPVDDA
ncbi:Twin-arginine translocation protein TatB [Olavius sp. associated proteobacterium Delta 1]|nr:Twin-arginine translocation protein TatB [Olavius sp. associated proteobacterium Delta 1]